jgi:hypothetical protein
MVRQTIGSFQSYLAPCIFFFDWLLSPLSAAISARFAGLAFATAHTLVTFFVCRLVLPRVGGADREAVGGEVFNRSPAHQQIAPAILGGRGGAAKPSRRATKGSRDRSRPSGVGEGGGVARAPGLLCKPRLPGSRAKCQERPAGHGAGVEVTGGSLNTATQCSGRHESRFATCF